MKIAFQSKSENPDLTLAERIGRFVLAIFEMIPIINYAVCALDKHLIFKEKISIVVPSTQEEEKLKESEVVTRQTSQAIPIPVKKLSQASDSQIHPIQETPEEKVISLSEDEFTQENNENVIVQVNEEQEITLSQEEIFTDEESSSSEDVLYIVNTKKLSDTPISDELQKDDDVNLENDEIIQFSGEEQSASDDVGNMSGEEIPSDTSISEESEEFEQDNIPSELEHDEFLQNSEEEVSEEEISLPKVRYNPRFDEVDSEETSCLDSAWKVAQAVTTLAFMFGVGYFIQKQLFGSNSPPSNPGLDLNELNPTTPPPLKPHTFDTPIYTPPILQTDQLDKPKICLLTAYTSDNSERLEMSKKVANNQRDYSTQKGYAYLEYTNNLAVETDLLTGATTKWEPYWSKIAAVNKILNNKESALEDQPEWIIWLDDDAVITNPDIKMEDIIAHYTKDQRKELNFFVTTDAISYKLQHIPLNSAVLFIRNNDWSRKFFARVWEMRKTQVPGQTYTYGNCPNQWCLHEQDAITQLLKSETIRKHVKIIPQRDPEYPVGINTFVREKHIDLNRQNLLLEYDDDLESSKGVEGDFIQQCTGLSTRAKKVDARGNVEWTVRNLRLECINKLLKIPEPKSWNEFFSNV